MLFSSCCLQEKSIAIPIYSSTWCGWFQVSLLPASHGSRYAGNTCWGRKTWCTRSVALAHFLNEREKKHRQNPSDQQCCRKRPSCLMSCSCHPWVVATELAPGPRVESQQVWERELKKICRFAILRRMDFVHGTI